MGNNIFEKLAEKYPFITLCVYASNEYMGIVQNRDDAVTTIYDFGAVLTQDDKLEFLELANTWWWESNRSIPSTYSCVGIGKSSVLLCVHSAIKILRSCMVLCAA
jgi:hypothetical protein